MKEDKHSQRFEEIVRRARTGEKSPSTIKKRRLSRLFLIVDGIIISLILIYLYQSTPKEEQIYKKSITYDQYTFTLYAHPEPEKNKITYSLSILSNSDKNQTLFLKKRIADLNINSGQDLITQKIISKNLSMLLLAPNEKKSFIVTIEDDHIVKYAHQNKHKLVPKENNILLNKKNSIPLNAELIIYTEKKLILNLETKYKVE